MNLIVIQLLSLIINANAIKINGKMSNQYLFIFENVKVTYGIFNQFSRKLAAPPCMMTVKITISEVAVSIV